MTACLQQCVRGDACWVEREPSDFHGWLQPKPTLAGAFLECFEQAGVEVASVHGRFFRLPPADGNNSNNKSNGETVQCPTISCELLPITTPRSSSHGAANSFRPGPPAN